MAIPLPPVLESQRPSEPAGFVGDGGFVIHCTWPRHLIPSQVGHVQVLIRRQLTMESWATQTDFAFAPEREEIYLSPAHINWTLGTITVPRGALRSLLGPASGVLTGGNFNASPSTENLMGLTGDGQTYTIQVRFGGGPLWGGAPFATWRANEIAARRFGEWSNTQRMFVFGLPNAIPPAADTLANRLLALAPTLNIHPRFLGGFSWSYNPISNDPLAQARVAFSYRTPDTENFTMNSFNVPFQATGGPNNTWGAWGDVEFEIARLTVMTVTLRLITVNNTVFTRSITIPRYLIATSDASIRGTTTIETLIGEELEDGVISVVFENTVADSSNFSQFFRVNAYTLEAIRLGEMVPETVGQQFRYRDYAIEMGGEYLYIGLHPIGADNFGGYAPMAPLVATTNTVPYDILWRPQDFLGRGRQMSFNGTSFLTSNLQQLRLTGNVTVRNFNRVTSDQITQTIGGQFPFYSRAAQFNYRTLAVGALITLHHDPTHTFLNLIRPEVRAEGWWNSDLRFRHSYVDYEMGIWGAPTGRFYDEQVILRRDDIFGGENYNPNMRRIQDDDSVLHQKMMRNEAPDTMTDDMDFGGEDFPVHGRFVPGSLATYGKYQGRHDTRFEGIMGQDTTFVMDSEDSSKIIYAERKFREVVMKWLTDGRPKLFRSETEGNMIVMVTGVSFTPLTSDRRVYSFSATLTEIAALTQKNLRLYDLIPQDFSGTFLEDEDFINNPEFVSSRQFRFFPALDDAGNTIPDDFVDPQWNSPNWPCYTPVGPCPICGQNPCINVKGGFIELPLITVECEDCECEVDD